MMHDPMANLTGEVPGESGDASDPSSKGAFDVVAMQVNMNRIERIRAVMGIVSGCVAGILGLTGVDGLVCFLLLHVIVSMSIWAVKMRCDLQRFTKLSWWKYMSMSLQPTALSFTLFWTLFYGLVYLY